MHVLLGVLMLCTHHLYLADKSTSMCAPIVVHASSNVLLLVQSIGHLAHLHAHMLQMSHGPLPLPQVMETPMQLNAI